MFLLVWAFTFSSCMICNACKKLRDLESILRAHDLNLPEPSMALPGKLIRSCCRGAIHAVE